jgi:hypothetical protein
MMRDGSRKALPSDPDEFDRLLLKIDQQLADKGIGIPWRPLRALGLVSQECGIPLPLGPFPPGVSHPAGKNWPVSKRIHEWYEHRYGDRLKTQMGPGRMAFLIGNDVWVFRFPLFYGRIRMVASRTAKSVPMSTSGQPAVHNILDSVEGLPEGLRHSLSDSELLTLADCFRLGFEGLEQIQSLGGDDLIKSALADIDASVDHLSGDKPNYPLAKWSSLQAAEKVLKAAIRQRGGAYSKTHELSELTHEAAEAGLRLQIDEVVHALQCSAGIRYGEEPCSLRQAIDAHHAVFRLVHDVTEALRERAGPC